MIRNAATLRGTPVPRWRAARTGGGAGGAGWSTMGKAACRGVIPKYVTAFNAFDEWNQKKRALLPELIIGAIIPAGVRRRGRAATLVFVPCMAILASRVVLRRRGGREAAGLVCPKKKKVNLGEVGFHLRGRTYHRTSTNFQCETKGSSSRTYPRSGRSTRWRPQHTSSYSRRAGVGAGRALGDTAALVVIPKFVGLAHRVTSHDRRRD